ncbi:hypothetical protein Slin14017_G128240 [Septoria linicola]|nr:hypothetical protein Slin14017_G128240 [Septoria linicola]
MQERSEDLDEAQTLKNDPDDSTEQTIQEESRYDMEPILRASPGKRPADEMEADAQVDTSSPKIRQGMWSILGARPLTLIKSWRSTASAIAPNLSIRVRWDTTEPTVTCCWKCQAFRSIAPSQASSFLPPLPRVTVQLALSSSGLVDVPEPYLHQHHLSELLSTTSTANAPANYNLTLSQWNLIEDNDAPLVEMTDEGQF